MTPLVDADILRYEVASVGDAGDEGPRSFEYVVGILQERVAAICHAVKATQDPIMYLTLAPTFRDAVAVTKPYKGGRKTEKPTHFANLLPYFQTEWECRHEDGLEADDLMCIDQTEDTIICTRDKDLRQCPGWHYGWECGAQREYGPRVVTHDGQLNYTKNKLTGDGMMWFWAQLLMGDSTDNIPGCPGIGPKKAFDLLAGESLRDMPWIVLKAYERKGKGMEMLEEQAQLLWMVRERTPEGGPKYWNVEDYYKE